jgi:hypothetical protein
LVDWTRPNLLRKVLHGECRVVERPLAVAAIVCLLKDRRLERSSFFDWITQMAQLRRGRIRCLAPVVLSSLNWCRRRRCRCRWWPREVSLLSVATLIVSLVLNTSLSVLVATVLARWSPRLRWRLAVMLILITS